MYNVHMTIALFFIVLSVACAGDNDIVIPSYWTRTQHTPLLWERLRSSPVQALKSIRINRSPKTREAMVFDLPPQDVWIEMDCSDHDPNKGTLFEVQLVCQSCYESTLGHVMSASMNPDKRRFFLAEPKEISTAHCVMFDKTNTHKPKVFCAYYAEKTHFTVSRVLCEYEDLSYFFVSAQVTYARAHNVVIEWGIKERDGSLRASNEKSRQEFNFPLCACRGGGSP